MCREVGGECEQVSESFGGVEGVRVEGPVEVEGSPALVEGAGGGSGGGGSSPSSVGGGRACGESV